MANLRIQVIGVSDETVTKGSKSYNKLTVTYKNLTNPDKQPVEVKNLMSFTYPEVYNTLKNAETKALYQVTSEKVNEYWTWTEIHRDDGAPPAAVETPVSKSAPATKAGSWDEKNALDRERFEYDKTKQTLIIRQSCLSSAVELVKTSKTAIAFDEVLKVAAEFEKWVNRKDLGSLNDMSDDIPY